MPRLAAPPPGAPSGPFSYVESSPRRASSVSSPPSTPPRAPRAPRARGGVAGGSAADAAAASPRRSRGAPGAGAGGGSGFGAGETPYHELYFAAQVAAGVPPALPAGAPPRARLSALEAWLRRGSSAILVEAPRAGGGGFPGEYAPAALRRMLDFFGASCGASAAAGSVLLDVGSGAGRPVFAAALSGHFARAVGIELNANREMCRWLAARFGVPNATFFRGDAGEWLPPGATHVYSFNRTFPPHTLAAIARRLNAYPTWRYLVSSLDARAWAAHGLRGATDVCMHTHLRMAGSGSNHAMFVVVRSRKGGKAAPAPAPANAAPVRIGGDDDGGGEDAVQPPPPPPRVRRKLA